MQQLHKTTLNHRKNINQDDNLRNLQIIREKESKIQILQDLNECLQKSIQQLQIQLQHPKQYVIDTNKMTKLENTNVELKKMLTETQDYVIASQHTQLEYQNVQQLINNILSPYQLNPKTTITQQLKFIAEQLINQNITEQIQELSNVIIALLPKLQNQNVNIPQIESWMEKYFRIHKFYHPLSTKQQINTIMLQLLDGIPNSTGIQNKARDKLYASEFNKQIQQISLITTAVDIVTVDEEQLMQQNKEYLSKIRVIQDQLQDQQNNNQVLNQQIIGLQNAIKQLEQQSNRQPFIDVLSASQIQSELSDNNSDDSELNNLKVEIDQKDQYIGNLETIKQQLLDQLKQLKSKETYWDLQIYCTDGILKSIIKSHWELCFKNPSGVSDYNHMISLYSPSSKLLQSLMERLNGSIPQFTKFNTEQYSNHLNQDIVYFKIIKHQLSSLLYQVKLIPVQFQQQFQQVDQHQIERIALDELWIQFSLHNGLLCLVFETINESELQLITRVCLIQDIVSQEQIESKVIVIYSSISVYIQELLASEQGFTIGMSHDNQYRYLINSDDFTFQDFNLVIGNDKCQYNYMNQFREFLSNKLLDYYNTNTTDPEFDIGIISPGNYKLRITLNTPKYKVDRLLQYLATNALEVNLRMENQQSIIEIHTDHLIENVKAQRHSIDKVGTFIILKIQSKDNTLRRWFWSIIPKIFASSDKITVQENKAIIILNH